MVSHLTYLHHPHAIKNDLKEKTIQIWCLGVLLLLLLLLFVCFFLRQILAM